MRNDKKPLAALIIAASSKHAEEPEAEPSELEMIAEDLCDIIGVDKDKAKALSDCLADFVACVDGDPGDQEEGE